MKKNKFLMKWNSRGIITALLCLMTFSAFAQTKTVKGTVIDSQNEPLIGAAVKVLGGTSGTITDFDGNFTLTNVPEKATLEFSYIGMKAQTVAVAGQTMLKIKMEDAKTALNEVVVVGYGVQKR